MSAQTFTSFAEYAKFVKNNEAIDQRRKRNEADIAAAKRLKRSEPLRRRNPRRPGTGPTIVSPEMAA